jgi:hypothetical protein
MGVAESRLFQHKQKVSQVKNYMQVNQPSDL